MNKTDALRRAWAAIVETSRREVGCDAAVLRNGDDDVCGRPAVAVAYDGDPESDSYGVAWLTCVHHTIKARVVPLSALHAAGLDFNKLGESS